MHIVADVTDYTSLVIDGAVLHVWRQNTITGASHLHQAINLASDQAGGPVPVLIVVEPDTPPPTADVRREIASVMQQVDGQVRMSALAFEGSGFGAAMARSVVTGLSLLARHSYPYKVFATVEHALLWMERSGADVEKLRRVATRVQIMQRSAAGF